MQVTISKKQIWTTACYSLLTLSIMVGFMYLNAFATEVLMIPAGTLATALLIAKTIDFIVSMFAGVIIEKVPLGKYGKNQGWLAVGRWILLACIAVEVFPTQGPVWLKCLIMGVGYAILNSLMNLIQTAYYGVVAIVAGPNPANRTAITTTQTRMSTVVTLVTSFIPTLVSKLQFGQWNYFIVAIVFALPMPFALGAIAKQADGETPAGKGPAGAPRISIKDMLDCLVHNPMLLVLFLVNVCLNIGSNILSNQSAYYWMYVAGDFSKMTVNSLTTAIVGFFAAMIMPKLGAKLGKRNAMRFGYCWMALMSFCMWYFGRMGWKYMIVCAAINAIGTYTYMPYSMLLWMDVGEWYLNKTGKDTRGICMGLASPPMKIGMAVGGTIGLKLLAASGYEAGFTPDAAWVTRFMNGSYLVTACCYAAVALIFFFGYRISDEDAVRYAQENAANMAKK